jgi:lipopolysaccharide/colanic/teichoic acid biosynthesis glycosyltransferase
MKVGTKIAGTHEVSEASVTRIGAIIRKLKIDELPQAWNIICNQMSLVGPRPCLPVQFELIEARRRHGVFDVKCGLTGLAQINDIDMSIPERLAKIDASYLAMRSLPFDIKIILRTFLGAGRADRVSRAFDAPE